MIYSFVKTLGGAVAIAAMAASAAAATEFNIAMGDGRGGTQEALGEAFIAALEEHTGGTHTAKLFPNGQLGTEQDTVSSMGMGTLDFSILAANNIAPFSPQMGLLTLPYMMLSVEDAVKLTQGGIGQMLIDETIENAGVRVIAWGYSGFRVFSNSERPVRTVEDMQGLVVRVPKNEVMIETYRSWGINPTPMSWNETFAALQQGVVDAQDTPYMTIYAMKFNEVQDYITNLRYLFLIEPLVISESLFQSLSPEEQEQILAAGRDASAASATFLTENVARVQEELTTLGMEIVDPADDEAEFIERATTAVWPNMVDSVGGKERLNQALAAMGRDPVE